ncbi:MAG: tetratricopeptide repeat protein, partial [Gammaproteobacteria bacterium]|nr:tetratricopeptide repeat protein [Gammaproteobacteria bacterium]
DLRESGVTLAVIEGRDLPADMEYRSLRAELQKHLPASDLWVLSLSHLEELTRPTQSPESASSFIMRLNIERDNLVQALPNPVLLWVSPATVWQLAEYAPDFYDLRMAVLELPGPESRGYEVLPRFPPSIMTAAATQALPEKTLKTLRAEADDLRFFGNSRKREQGRRFISILSDLAGSHGRGRGVAFGLNELEEALAEARRLELPEEQARLHAERGKQYAALAKRQDAASCYEAALGLYRTLAKQSPDVYRPDLVHTLNRLANLLSQSDKSEKLYREALALSRDLIKQQPEAYLPLLAKTLNNLALALANRGKAQAAKPLYEETVQHCRRLV